VVEDSESKTRAGSLVLSCSWYSSSAEPLLCWKLEMPAERQQQSRLHGTQRRCAGSQRSGERNAALPALIASEHQGTSPLHGWECHGVKTI